jgi:DinB superfamily
MMKKSEWFERKFQFGLPAGMLPFYIERLKGTIARLESKVIGVPEAILSHQLNGKWSVKQNIGHLAEVDEIAIRRIDEMIAGAPIMSPAVFEPRLDYNNQSVHEVLAFFLKNRTKNIDRYETLSEDDIGKSSLHPRLKVMMTPIDLAWFDAEHDDHHLVRINEILSALK